MPAQSDTRAQDAAGIGGLHEPVFEVVADLHRFAASGKDTRLELFGAALAPPQLPPWGEAALPAAFLAEHRAFVAPGPIEVYAVGGATLWGLGLVTHGRSFVAPPDVMPGYIMGQLAAMPTTLPSAHAGPLGRADVETLASELPLATVLHPNFGYPRFLLEMLPRLWGATVLRAYGVAFRLALPIGLPPWAADYVRLLGLDRDALSYDPRRHCVSAPSIILPPMLHRDYSFHPVLNLVVDALTARAGPPAAGAPTHVFLRRSALAPQRIDNEEAVAEAMARLGFAVVDSHRLPLPERLRLLAGAQVVAGEYGAALYDALFAPAGARIIALNFANDYQSKLARVRRQTIGYVAPADGMFRHWRLNRNPVPPDSYGIDLDALRAMVREVAPELS